MCLFFLVLPLSRGLRALFSGLMVSAWWFWGMNTWPSDLPFSHHCPTCHVYSIVLDEFFLFWTFQQISLLLNPMSFVYISPLPLPCLYLSLRLLISTHDQRLTPLISTPVLCDVHCKIGLNIIQCKPSLSLQSLSVFSSFVTNFNQCFLAGSQALALFINC